MMESIDRRQAENMLRNSELILKRIAGSEKKIRILMADEESVIRQASLKSPDCSLVTDCIRNGYVRDIGDTYEKYLNISGELGRCIKRQMDRLTEEKESVVRFMACLEAAKALGRYYEVLYENVVNEIPLEALAFQFKRSENTINLWKRKALDMIVNLYNHMDLTAEEIRNFGKRQKELIKGEADQW